MKLKIMLSRDVNQMSDQILYRMSDQMVDQMSGRMSARISNGSLSKSVQ